jgi:hypothetical protein
MGGPVVTEQFGRSTRTSPDSQRRWTAASTRSASRQWMARCVDRSAASHRGTSRVLAPASVEASRPSCVLPREARWPLARRSPKRPRPKEALNWRREALAPNAAKTRPGPS